MYIEILFSTNNKMISKLKSSHFRAQYFGKSFKISKIVLVKMLFVHKLTVWSLDHFLLSTFFDDKLCKFKTSVLQ